MAGLTEFYCRLNETSHASKFKWLDNTFNADPDTDPDPAFFITADPDSGSGSRIRIQGLMT